MIDSLAASKGAEIAGSLPPNKRLTAPDGSYLERLEDLFPPLKGEFDPTGKVLTEVSGMVQSDVHVHHVNVDQYSTEAANAVLPLIHLTRNMVIPDIRTVVDEVNDYMSTRQHDISATLGYTVSYRERCLLSTTPNITTAVDRYGKLVATTVQGGAVVNEAFSATDLMEALRSTKERINAFVAQEIEEHFDEIYSLLRGNYLVLNSLTPSSLGIVFLYAQYAYDAPPTGISGTLHAYNATMQELTEQTGRKLFYYIENWTTAVERGRLYDGVRVGNEVVLNGEVYRAGVERGLSVELVLANERLGRRHVTVDEILENGEALARAFESERNGMRVAFDNEANQEMRVALLAAMSRLIQGKDQEALPTSADVLMDDMRNRVAKLTHNEIANMVCTVRDLVCGLLYPHTGARDLIVIADHIGEEQPDIDPREAFAFAVAEYISKWYARQLQCV